MHQSWDKRNVGGGMSAYMGPSGGRGPRGYQRADERIMEEVCEALTWDPDVDATDVEVRVEDGVVTLEGAVQDRGQKRRAEDVACEVRGVSDVQNRLRIGREVHPPPTPVVGPGAGGLTGVGDGTTAVSGGLVAGVADMPGHNPGTSGGRGGREEKKRV